MKRLIRTGEEQDAFTGWRHYLRWKPHQRKRVKRRANKRERREAKQERHES
jgi:hypothetical protein